MYTLWLIPISVGNEPRFMALIKKSLLGKDKSRFCWWN